MKIKLSIMLFAVIACISISCTNSGTKQNDEVSKTDTTNQIIKKSIANKEGLMLDLIFDNKQNTAVVVFNNDTLKLKGNAVASGFLYSNETYMLRGKGNDITLTKNDSIIFNNQENIE